MHLFIHAILSFSWIGFIMYLYYTGGNHTEYTQGYGMYLGIVGAIYLYYKYYQLYFSDAYMRMERKMVIGFLLFHIGLLTFFYTGFAFPEIDNFWYILAQTVKLYLHIVILCVYPLFLLFLWRTLGMAMTGHMLSGWRDIDTRLRIPIEIALGVTIFSLGLIFLGSIHMFDRLGLLILLMGLIFLTRRQWASLWYDLVTFFQKKDVSVSQQKHHPLSLYQISVDFTTYFISLLFGIACIVILRPMPIGADDMGVYMNIAKILATSGEFLSHSGMYTWQLITATGFLVSGATQAFYVNLLGSILATLSLIGTISYVTIKKGYRPIISLAALFGLVYYMMPMNIFQYMKDMKLDSAYLFFIICSSNIILFLWNPREKNMVKNYTILALAGWIAGWAFTIKITAIIPIIGLVGLIVYRFFRISGYIVFQAVLIGVFTFFDIWRFFYIPTAFPPGWIVWVTSICGCMSLMTLGYIYYFYKKSLLRGIVSVCIFSLSIVLAILPWGMKNISMMDVSKDGFDIYAFVGLYSGQENFDYHSLYTEKELLSKTSQQIRDITPEGTSENEDYARYFGHEKGINNYLKMPFNTTFQTNQKGDFTDITFLFLALLPVAIIFTLGKYKYSMTIVGYLLMLGMIGYYIHPSYSPILTSFFSEFGFISDGGDWRYSSFLILLLLYSATLSMIYFFTSPRVEYDRIREMIILFAPCGFLVMISSFGISWYGIVIYFFFFLFMVYGFLPYILHDTSRKIYTGSHIAFSTALFVIVGVYAVYSTFPYAWNILRHIEYRDYKYMVRTEDEAIFQDNNSIIPIATLNLHNPGLLFSEASGMPELSTVKIQDSPDIHLGELQDFIEKNRNHPNPLVRGDIHILSEYLYTSVLYPPPDNQNTGGIYRTTPSLTYLIHNNKKRSFNDILLSYFSLYFYDPVPEVTRERLQKLGIRYLLIDLHTFELGNTKNNNIIRRYAELIHTLQAQDIALLYTNNICFEKSFLEFQRGNITYDTFARIAGIMKNTFTGIYGEKSSFIERKESCHRLLINDVEEIDGFEYFSDLPYTAQESLLIKNLTSTSFAVLEILDK